MAPEHHPVPVPTWAVPRTRYVLSWLAVAVVTAVFVWSALVPAFLAPSRWWSMFLLLLLAWNVAVYVRTAFRIRLHPDGQLELVRPIGTTRVHVADVRRVGGGRFRNNRSPLALHTVDRKLRIDRGIDGLPALFAAMREHNPAIGG